MGNTFTEQDKINQAAAILREGGLIAFPTETYYGLAVDPFNESALKRLFTVKERPSVKPVLVLISSQDQLTRLAEAVPAVASLLMDRFWPGPLTIVLSARRDLSVLLTGGTGTIGVRFSPHPIAQELLKAYGGPLTATSANRFGGEPAVNEEQVGDIFGNDIDMILPGGRTPGKKPSTLVGFEDDSVICLREGCISYNVIEQYLRTVA